MDALTALKTLHVAALLVLLLSGLGLAAWLVKGRRAGNLAIHDRLLKRPQGWAWAVMALGLAALPFSGWWLIHGLGLSLGQTWILSSSLLYTLGTITWAWLLARLAGSAGGARFNLALATVTALCFGAIAVLLLARPG